MNNEPNREEAIEQITEIREAFERAENMGDASVIEKHCTDDVVVMPPGQPPAVGKEVAKRGMEELFEAVDLEIEYTSEEIVVDGDIAMNRLSARETHIPKDGGDAIEHTADSLWIYRRSPDGEWKQSHAIWNYRE